MTERDRSKVVERVDEEFAGQRGNTLSDASLEDEKHADMRTREARSSA